VHSPLDRDGSAFAAPVRDNVKARDPPEVLDVDIKGTGSRRGVLRLHKPKLDDVVAVLEVEQVLKQAPGAVMGGASCPGRATFVKLVIAASSVDGYLTSERDNVRLAGSAKDVELAVGSLF
jgi:hypothetical protein